MSPDTATISSGLRAILRTGDRPQLGTFVEIPRVEIVEALGSAGYDFVILDCEHGPYGIDSLLPLLAAARGAGLKSVVRTQDASPQPIGAALDAGADGVLVPRIPSFAAAEAAVGATRLPPTGSRGVNPYIRAASYGLDRNYLQAEDSRRAAMLMLEDLGAVAEIDRIVAIAELDCLFIGPFDLSAGAGAPGRLDHPKVLAAVDVVLERARASQVAVGAFAATPETARDWIARGVKLIALSTDAGLAAAGFRGALEEIRESTTARSRR